MLPHRADLARLSSRTAARSAHEIRRVGCGSGLHLCIICNLVSHGQDLLRWSSTLPLQVVFDRFPGLRRRPLSIGLDPLSFPSPHLLRWGDPRTSLLSSLISSRGALRMEVLIFGVLSSSSCSDLSVRIDHGVPRIASSICVSCLSGGGNLRIVLARNVLSLVPITCMSDLPSRPSQIPNLHEDANVQLDPLGSLHITVSPKGNICPPQSRCRCLKERCLEKAAASDCPIKDGMIRGTSPRRTLLCRVREAFGHHPQLICGLSQLLQVIPCCSSEDLVVPSVSVSTDCVNNVNGCVSGSTCKNVRSSPNCLRKSSSILTACMSCLPLPCCAPARLQLQTLSNADMHVLNDAFGPDLVKEWSSWIFGHCASNASFVSFRVQ